MNSDLGGRHLVWRIASGRGSSCATCGTPALGRPGASTLLDRGEPVATEAFAVIGGRGKPPAWVCIGCCSNRDGHAWTFDERDVHTAFHVTSPANRASILRHGLDWNWMDSQPGIAGGAGGKPELERIFLAGTADDAAFFITFAAPVDVWAVSVNGIRLEDGPDGWLVSRIPIPAANVRLIQADDWRRHHR